MVNIKFLFFYNNLFLKSIFLSNFYEIRKLIFYKYVEY